MGSVLPKGVGHYWINLGLLNTGAAQNFDLHCMRQQGENKNVLLYYFFDYSFGFTKKPERLRQPPKKSHKSWLAHCDKGNRHSKTYV